MKNGLAIFALLASLALCADEVRLVDGKLTRISSDKQAETQPQNSAPARNMDWVVREWEMSGQYQPAQKSINEKARENSDEIIPSENLAEKLARISAMKLKELEETPKEAETVVLQAAPAPQQNEQTSVETPPKKAPVADSVTLADSRPQTPPEPEKSAPRVTDEEIAEIEREYLALLKKVRDREVKTDLAETPALKETQEELLPTPQETMEIPDDASGKMLSDETIKRLKDDILEADLSQPEINEITLPNYYVYSSDCFNVISSNNDAKELGVSIVKTIEEAFAEYFGKGVLFSPKVNLQMLLEDEAKFQGYFQIIKDSHITISVKCDPGLPLDEFCNLVADSYFFELANALAGSQRPMPYWLSAALKAALAQRFAMGISYEMARFASKNIPDDIDTVASYSKDTPLPFEKMESSAYWNLVALKELSGSKENFTSLMRSLVGSDIQPLIAPLKERMGPAFHLQMRAIMLGEIYSRIGGVKSFEDSDSNALYFFAIQKQKEGTASETIFDKNIFARRGEIKNEIKFRIMEIKLALPWVNPIYYNAYVALGKMFDAAEKGDSEKFETHRNDFILELQKSRDAAKHAQRLLNAS